MPDPTRDAFLRLTFLLNRTHHVISDKPAWLPNGIKGIGLTRGLRVVHDAQSVVLFAPPLLSNREAWKPACELLGPGGYLIATIRDMRMEISNDPMRRRSELSELLACEFRVVELYADWRGNRWDRSSSAVLFARKNWGRGCPTGREPIFLVDRIWIREIGEPLVDVRKACPMVRVRARLPWLRESVARMLDEASRKLPPDHRLSVHTCLRTIDIQRSGYEGYVKRMRRLHPSWPESILRRESYRFFHPHDRKAPPGHCTGGAVDVSILGPDGKPLDFNSPFPVGMPYCRPYAPGLSVEARRNRDLLIETMESTGFSNCVDEYWHYSYGDSAWGVRMGQPVCSYGLIAASPDALRKYELLVARAKRKEDSRRQRESDRWIALSQEFEKSVSDLAQNGNMRSALELAFQSFELSLRSLFVIHTGSFPKDINQWTVQFEEAFVNEQRLPATDLKRVERSIELWRRIHNDPEAQPTSTQIDSLLITAAHLRTTAVRE